MVKGKPELKHPLARPLATQKVFVEGRRIQGLHRLLKIPILVSVLLLVVFNLICYFFVRLIIFCSENIFILPSKRWKLLQQSTQAKNYDDWKRYNLELDILEKNESWKTGSESSYYNAGIIEDGLQRLRDILDSMKHSGLNENSIDPDDIRFIEQLCIPNVGGLGNYHMYTNCRVGTKKVIHEYIDTIQKTVNVICKDESLDKDFRLEFIERIERSYGRTALVLSGGATFGFYHLGVIKVLLEQNLLPGIISGTSVGALFAAFCCVQKEEDILTLITPGMHPLCRVFENWLIMLKNYYKYGSMRDNEDFRQMAEAFLRSSIPNITFKEAFHKTGKILNISCSVDGNKQHPARQLNYITSPNCVISSAVVASAAIPILLRPQHLLYKGEDGNIHDYKNENFVWRDGSFKNDLPMKELGATFNANNFIVSQVNPHIIPFFFWNTGSPGKPNTHSWRGGFILSYLEAYFKLEMKKWARLINQMELFPDLFGQDITEIFLQETFGEVTIAPAPNIMNYFQFFRNVNYKRLQNYIQSGASYTWPNISLIQNTFSLEKTIKQCKNELVVNLGVIDSAN